MSANGQSLQVDPIKATVAVAETRGGCDQSLSVRPWRRFLLELAALVVMSVLFPEILARWRLLDDLLSPSLETSLPAAAFGFLAEMVRIFAIVGAPGWVLMRCWLIATRSRKRGESLKRGYP